MVSANHASSNWPQASFARFVNDQSMQLSYLPFWTSSTRNIPLLLNGNTKEIGSVLEDLSTFEFYLSSALVFLF